MNKNITHWSLDGALHRGPVDGCERCGQTDNREHAVEVSEVSDPVDPGDHPEVPC